MIAENVRNIRRQIEDACARCSRTPDEIKLVAVSKTFDSRMIREVAAAGVLDIGENYVQELQQKREDLLDLPLRWHFIGHLQTNKIKYIAQWISVIHSVDSVRLGQALSEQMAKQNRNLDVLVEVNTSAEPSKYGVTAEATYDLVRTLRQLPFLNVIGLMTIGQFGEEPEASRPSFRLLRELQQHLHNEGIELPHLSMGMSHDFPVAIEEGATIIRIGTSIFGNRHYS